MALKNITGLALLAFIFSAGCDINKNENDGGNVNDDGQDTINADTRPLTEANENSYNLPSALQIAYVFKKSGAAYDATLPNKSSGVNKYNISNFKRAINFGVYSADLSYCIFNKKYAEAKEYLKACKDLGSSLALNQAFESDDAAQRFEKYITNEDSVVKIVANVQMKSDIMFEENKQKHISLIAFTGAWTESAYIAGEAYAHDKNKKIMAGLFEQLLLSETIVKGLKNYEANEPEIKSLLTSVEEIHTCFYSIPSVKKAIEKDEEMDFATMAITNEEIEGITRLIKTLRTTIVD